MIKPADAREPDAPIAVVTTVGTRDEAMRIAEALVARRLAACVQIGVIESVYAWKGELHRDPEFRVLAKTTEQRYAAVEAAIRELHSYELPAIHAIAFAHVFAPYGEWIAENSNGRS